MRAEDVADSVSARIDRRIGARLETIEARLDDIAGMLGEVFDQMHPCQECIDSRHQPERRTTSVERRRLTLTVEPLHTNEPPRMGG